MARQALSEGVGEGATEIANILADCVIMAEKSNWQTNIDKYITQENMTPEAARKKAFADAALQVGEAVAGGLVSGAVSSSAFTGVQSLVDQASYAKTGAGIMDTDGGVEALISVANEAAGVSSEDLRDQLTTQIDKVNQKPTAGNVGQLNATVQAVNDQANTPVAQPNAAVQTANDQALATGNQASAVGKPENTSTNQANASMNPVEVAGSLQGKGIPPQKIDTLAEAIVRRVYDQKLTRTQSEILSFEQKRSSVRNILSNLIQKKARGIDSVQHNGYDKISTTGGNAVTGGSALHQEQNTFLEGIPGAGADTVTYRRVQGGGGNNTSQERIKVNADGSISIPNKEANLSISIDGGEHAQYFLNKRGGDAQIIAIDVPKWFDDFLQENAIPQVNYKTNPLNQGGAAPKITDITTPGNCFELPAPWIEWLEEYGGNARIVNP